MIETAIPLWAGIPACILLVLGGLLAVSYTHLTLPTSDLV